MKRTLFKRIILYIISLFLISIGVNMFLLARLGLGSWDVLHNNLTTYFGLTFGTWVFIVGITTVLISMIFKYDLKSFLTVLNSFILGFIIDFFLFNVFTFEVVNIWYRIIIFIVGVILLGNGISLLILTKFPPTPPDILMLAISHRFKLNFTISKTIGEAAVFLIAIIIGYIGGNAFGNIGVGTIILLLTIGIAIELSSKYWKKTFNL